MPHASSSKLAVIPGQLLRSVPPALLLLLAACGDEGEPQPAVPERDGGAETPAISDEPPVVATSETKPTATAVVGDAGLPDATKPATDADWSRAGCIPDSVHIFGELEGRSLDIVHPAPSLGFFSDLRSDVYSVRFGRATDSLLERSSATHTFAASPSPGRMTKVQRSRITLEAPSVYADRELCADGSAEGMREGDRMAVFMPRVAALKCPGVPVAGTVTVTRSGLSGEVDGRPISGAVRSLGATGGDASTGTQELAIDGVELSLTTDDPTLDRPGGKILDGRLTFTDAHGNVTGIYCVGSGDSFTRQGDDNLDVSTTLTSLSKLGTCAENAALGSLTFCAQDSFFDR